MIPMIALNKIMHGASTYLAERTQYSLSLSSLSLSMGLDFRKIV